MNLSFLGPIAANQAASRSGFTGPDPNLPIEGNDVTMTPETFKATFDEDYRRERPLQAAMHAYRHRFQDQTQPGHVLGSVYGPMVMDKLRSGAGLFAHGPGAAALGMGAGGAAIGLLGALGWNGLTNRVSVNPLTASLMAGLLGAGIGGFGGYAHRSAVHGYPGPRSRTSPRMLSPDEYMAGISSIMGKTASWRGGNSFNESRKDREAIQAMLRNAPGLSFNERAHLVQGVQQLSDSEVGSLRRLLRSSGGSMAIGALVARFLLGKGLISTLVGAVAGGAVSKAFFNSVNAPRTFGGQRIGRFHS